MDFGIFNLMQMRQREVTSKQVVDTAIAEVKHAEALGYSRAWFVEHHFSNYSINPSPLMMIAHAAGVTSRIRLGSAVVIAPLHEPARLLAEIGLADCVSNGRLDLGLGSGYQRFEFERLSAELSENKERFHEMLDMLELGMTEPSFSYEGKHYKQLKTAISMRPVQTPHPPIWIAGHDPVAWRRCARNAWNVFIAARFTGGKDLGVVRNQVAEAWRAEGKDPANMNLSLLSFVHVTDSKADAAHYVDCARFQHRISMALRERREMVANDFWVDERPFAGEPPIEDLAAIIPVGDPETVAQRMIEQIDHVGPMHIACYFQVGDMPQAKVMRGMERMMTEVVPLIEKHYGRPLAELNAPKRLPLAAE